MLKKFSTDERTRITEALDGAVTDAGLSDEVIWGDKIEDRGSQITFFGLGQQAPLEAKSKWDPDLKKCTRLKELIEVRLPNIAVRIGRLTSIDITLPGIDKAYGIGKLAGLTGFSLKEMLFVGDALYPGGNDAPVRDAGVATIAVRDPGETKVAIRTMVEIFKTGA